jgi:hypothetical protein
MLRQDKIWVGAFTALVFPLFFFVIYYELNDLLIEKNMLRAYVRAKRDNALRGSVSITLLYVFGIVIFFYKSLITG